LEVRVLRDLSKAKKIVKDKYEARRLLAEEEIRESEREYRELYETVKDGIAAVDLKGKFIECNQAFLNMMGYSAAEIGKKRYQDITPKKWHTIEAKIVADQIKARGYSDEYEKEYIKKDGTVFHISIKVWLKKDREGKPAGMWAIIRDITERKEAKEALRKGEEEFRLAFENAKDAVLWGDTKTGLITNCNKAAEILLERKRGEIVGLHQTMIHPPQKAEYYANMFKTHIKQKGTVGVEAEVITKSGKIKPVQITATVTLVGGKPIIQGIFRDITERKRVEEALRESEEKFRNLAEKLPNMIFINKKGRVVYANERSEEVMGYKKGEFYSPDFNFLTLIAPESIDLVRKAFSRHMEGKEVVPYEYTLITKEGKRIEAIITTKLIHYEGDIVILGIVTDITERKQAEGELKRLSSIVDAMVDGVSITDLHGKLTYINRAVTKQLGYKKEELIGKLSTEFIAEKDKPKFAAEAKCFLTNHYQRVPSIWLNTKMERKSR